MSSGVTEHNREVLHLLRSVVCHISCVRQVFDANHESVVELSETETERKELLEGKLREYHSQYLSFCKYLSKTNHLKTTSIQISLCIAKHGKPLSDGDFIKMVMLSGSNSL